MFHTHHTQPVTSDIADLPQQPSTAPQRFYRIPPAYHDGHTRHPYQKPRPLTVLFFLLAIIALAHFIAVLHTPTATVTSIDCPTLLHTTDYTKYIPFHPQQQTIGAIQFINQLVDQPAVLVPVTSNDTPATLDVYVYGCAMQQHTPTLALLFKQQGLNGGTVSISTAHTLVLSSIDTSIPAQNAVMLPSLQNNIYREYRWQQQSFVQVAFAGLYPVLSRGEAEALQQQSNSGQPLPWSDPLVTAQQMAHDLLQRSATNAGDMILDNDGTTAHVRLVQQQPALTLIVTVTRLIQQNASGLWFVTGVQTQGMTLQQDSLTPKASSPLNLHGTTTLSGGSISATLFDHTLGVIQTLGMPVSSHTTDGTYSTSIVYTNNQPDQPGLLLIEITPPHGSTASEQVLLQGIILG